MKLTTPFLVLLFIMRPTLAPAQPTDRPPVAPMRPVIDDYFGTRIADSYRYMENLKDPEVQSWIKAQDEFASRVLRGIPGRDALLARIQELDAGAPYRIWIVRRWPNGDMHYYKTLASENIEKLYFKDATSGTEKLLIDPEQISRGESQSAHYSLGFAVPSLDERYIAYGLAAAGSEQTTLRIFDSVAGKDLPERIDRFEDAYTSPQWLPDSSGFFYSRRRQLPPGSDPTEVYKQTKAYFHKLGTDPKDDKLIFAMNSSPAVPMGEADFPGIFVPLRARFVIAQVHHGDSSVLTLYSAPISALTNGDAASIPWRKICDVADEVEEFAVHAEDIYLMTAFGSPHYRIMRTGLENPSFKEAEIVLPESTAVIQSISTGKDALYIGVLDRGLGKLWRLPFTPNATIQPLDWPAGFTSGSPIVTHADVDGVLVSTSSWTRGGRIYSFDPGTQQFTDTNLRPRGKFDDIEGYESTEVLVKSHDGAQVPLSIVHKKGIVLDGSHPTLVGGYGGYGMVMDVYYDPTRIAWLERGGVIAIAHVRGGGEFGKDWHLAGQKATKPNTWKDFIACCEYLVKEKYTSPGKLAGQGGSAGGILIGRAITERPDLFAAALIQVGCTDMLRMETTTNGVPNIQEFGSVTTKPGFDALLEMSAINHVVDGTKYPAVLLTHGINDPRVEPWMSAKMTARLQAATRSGKPILFRVDYDAGHGIGSTKLQRQEALADSWAFLLDQMGEIKG